MTRKLNLTAKYADLLSKKTREEQDNAEADSEVDSVADSVPLGTAVIIFISNAKFSLR